MGEKRTEQKTELGEREGECGLRDPGLIFPLSLTFALLFY
jgi:hypothetical protein